MADFIDRQRFILTQIALRVERFFFKKTADVIR
jgi:hypothetical protein